MMSRPLASRCIRLEEQVVPPVTTPNATGIHFRPSHGTRKEKTPLSSIPASALRQERRQDVTRTARASCKPLRDERQRPR